MTPRATSAPARKSLAVAGVAGLLLLAGCGAADDAPEDPDAASNPAGSGTADATAYEDGTYTAEGSYRTPESVETVSVTLTLEEGIVTDVEVTGDPQARESQQYQGEFISGIREEVVGVAIDDLDVSRVAGSSLTSGGFNEAVESIKDQAAA